MESGPSPRGRQAGAPGAALCPGSIWQALAMEVTRYSSSVFLQPHQLISGWLQRAMTAPFFWCLWESGRSLLTQGGGALGG